MYARTSLVVALALATGCIQAERRRGQGTDTSTTDTTTGGDATSTATRDTTTADDADGCDGGCLIGQVCVLGGADHPDEPCQVCDPARDATAWSARPDETTCTAADPCAATGSCSQGACVAPLLPGCGTLPECASDIACDDDGCYYVLDGGACFIDGACRQTGALKPGNPCRWCEPDRDQFAWSDNDGRECDDGDACTYEDTCEAGQCGGTENDCRDQHACTLDFCDSGECVNQVEGDACLIAEACREDGDASPDAQCRVCDPNESQRDWTIVRGEGCDDGDVCTQEDTCDGAGLCKGSRIVMGHEPNEEPGQAHLVGEGVTTFPAGNANYNLNPLTDKDFIVWSMPLVGLDGIRRPTARVQNGSAREMTACVYAACGQVLNSLVKPTVLCGGMPGETLGPVAGCCDTVPAGEERTVAVEAVCPDGGTVQQGLGFAAVRFVSNVAGDQGPACGDYTIQWGAALK